jgi:hypothetical protein
VGQATEDRTATRSLSSNSPLILRVGSIHATSRRPRHCGNDAECVLEVCFELTGALGVAAARKPAAVSWGLASGVA